MNNFTLTTVRTVVGAALLALVGIVYPADLRVMPTGLGIGTITGTGIDCGNGAVDCAEALLDSATVVLTAAEVPGTGSTFAGWEGACSGTTSTCTLAMSTVRSVRARFDLTSGIAPLTGFTPADISAYLANPTNAHVNTPARFISALPVEFRDNWILMPRSESLQTGTAASPRILFVSADAQRVFTVGMTTSSSYPGAHPNAVEYMQWDATQKNFRFHEIVLAPIPAMGDVIDLGPPAVLRFEARSRQVTADDPKCFACHSTRNVLNRGSTPGTDGIPAGSVGNKNKPNWDTYDSWGGMLSFNRDRVYQGSVEAAALRNTLNLWTWIDNEPVRSMIEQLNLQSTGVPTDHTIQRDASGGVNDGHIRFGFDPPGAPVTTEPLPSGPSSISTNYGFDGAAGTGTATSVQQGGSFLTLHHPLQLSSDEGRGVELFDRLSAGPNQDRIADELLNHSHITGSLARDIRPLALAIAQRCITVTGGQTITATQDITSTPAFASTTPLGFFNSRNGITSFNQLYDDTRQRAWSLTRRKADIQKLDLDRTNDPYTATSSAVDGLIQEFGANTSGVSGGSGGTDTSNARLRQEVFRRPTAGFTPDSTVMGGIYVDRELQSNTDFLALYRYFLEPLGVPVDKWSMGVRGRSRTYTFADLFGGYNNTIATELKSSLGIPLSTSMVDVCDAVIPMVDSLFTTLPDATGPGAVPKYTDIQRIFNKSCIECHGGLGYPPYHNYGTFLNLSEDEDPPPGDRRMTRSYNKALGVTSAPSGTDVFNSNLFRRITGATDSASSLPPHLYDPLNTNESCPSGIMPCGGPPLNSADIETIRRWIIGGRTYTEGDPHIRTVDGTHYDFQSAGEFVLLRDEGMEIQARQTPVTTAGPLGSNAHTGLSSCVSINTAIALRVGRHRVTYQPNAVSQSSGDDVQPSPNRLLLRIDGKPRSIEKEGEIRLSSGGRIRGTEADGGIRVDYPGGTVVIITPGFWTPHQVWYLNINVRHARATDGVMGVITAGDWLPALPDGSSLGPRPGPLNQRHQDLYETFANAWRVRSDTSLFDYEPGLSTASFTVQSWPVHEANGCVAPPQPGVVNASVVPTPLTEAEAAQHCTDVADPVRKENCIADVVATGAPEFASTYLMTERIVGRQPPKPPVLSQPEDFTTGLLAPVTFTWDESVDTDRDGGSLVYRHCLWEVNEPFTLDTCTEVAPPATDLSDQPLPFWLLLLLLILLLLAAAIFGRHRRLLILLASLVLIALVFIGLQAGQTVATETNSFDVEAGKAYFWKVVVENEHGELMESATYRFETKP